MIDYTFDNTELRIFTDAPESAQDRNEIVSAIENGCAVVATTVIWNDDITDPASDYMLEAQEETDEICQECYDPDCEGCND